MRWNESQFPVKMVKENKLSGTEKNEFINECSNPGLIDVTTELSPIFIHGHVPGRVVPNEVKSRLSFPNI